MKHVFEQPDLLIVTETGNPQSFFHSPLNYHARSKSTGQGRASAPAPPTCDIVSNLGYNASRRKSRYLHLRLVHLIHKAVLGLSNLDDFLNKTSADLVLDLGDSGVGS